MQWGDEMKQFSNSTRKAKLLVHGDFIIGLPGETIETVEKTKKLIKETKPDILQVSVASPFPGTEFYDWCKENGYLLTDNPNEYLDWTRGIRKRLSLIQNLLMKRW